MAEFLTADQLAAVAEAALAAPSADNRHRLELHSLGDRLRVHLPAVPGQAATSYRRVLDLLSTGAAVENMLLESGRLGVSLDLEWRLDGPDGSVEAHLIPNRTVTEPDPIAKAIRSRHSNRTLRYRGPPLSPAQSTELDAQAARIDGAGLVWLDEPSVRRQALRLVRIAETARFANRELHHELFDSIRFDVGWTESAERGLPPGALGLSWFERPGFALLRHWPMQRALNLIAVHRLIGIRAGDLPCRYAPHLGAVTASGSLPAAALNAGRALQRVWLHATSLGLSMQIFAASPIYAVCTHVPLQASLLDELSRGWRTLCPRREPYLAFRLGFAAPTGVRAGRPSGLRSVGFRT